MGEAITLSLLLMVKKALNVALEKGIAISAAAVRRNEKYEVAYKVTDWDSRCENCLKPKKEGEYEAN